MGKAPFHRTGCFFGGFYLFIACLFKPPARRQRLAGTRKGNACPPDTSGGCGEHGGHLLPPPTPATCPRKNRSPVPAAGGPGVFPRSLPNPEPPSSGRETAATSGHQPGGGEGTRPRRCAWGWPSCNRRTCPAARTCAPRAAPSALTAAAP